MAAAVVPIIAALEPVVLPWIVKLVEKVFPPKSGTIKMSTVVAVVQQIAQGLAAATGLPQAPPPASPSSPPVDALTASIQKIVDALNAAGELQGASTVVPPASPLKVQTTAGTVSGLTVQDARMMLAILASVAPSLGAKL